MCIFCNDDPDKIREYGKAFGYPDCCIEEFIKDINILHSTDVDVRNEDQKDIARNTYGFVPCKMHTEMIINKAVTPEDLVRDRRNAEKSAELNRIAEQSED